MKIITSMGSVCVLEKIVLLVLLDGQTDGLRALSLIVGF